MRAKFESDEIYWDEVENIANEIMEEKPDGDFSDWEDMAYYSVESIRGWSDETAEDILNYTSYYPKGEEEASLQEMAYYAMAQDVISLLQKPE